MRLQRAFVRRSAVGGRFTFSGRGLSEIGAIVKHDLTCRIMLSNNYRAAFMAEVCLRLYGVFC